MTTTPQHNWQDHIWLKQTHDWICKKAKRNAIQLTGEIEQPHIFPWSTVMSVSSNEGILFFKATAPETVYKSALTQKLAGWLPDWMPDLIAVDTTLGWMLMRDGGEQLRASIRPTQDIKPWEPVIALYAELQIALAQHVDEILALGIPDHRPALLPSLY